jgi:hypothetical protein
VLARQAGRTLTFQAGPETANAITIGRIFPKPFYWGVQDKGAGATIVTGTGCHVRTRSAYPFECDSLAAGEINRVRIFAGSLDDSIDVDVLGGSSVEAPVVVFMVGGPGNDTLTGGPQPDVITGGPGVNVAKGADGNDRLQMRNGTRDTLVDCGAGIDTAVIDRVDRPIGCEHAAPRVGVSRKQACRAPCDRAHRGVLTDGDRPVGSGGNRRGDGCSLVPKEVLFPVYPGCRRRSRARP